MRSQAINPFTFLQTMLTHRSLMMRNISSQLSLCFLGLGLLMLGCDETTSPTPPPQTTITSSGTEVTAGDDIQCIPDCDGRSCGIDPRCGISCGQCQDSEHCEAARCVTDPMLSGVESSQIAGEETVAGQEMSAGESSCESSCESSNAECGELCGISCGQCDTGSNCIDGRCICIPQCNGLVCGAADGCGGTCTPCPSTESCTHCVLRLRLLSFEEREGVVVGAKVALSINLPEEAPHPEIADLHLELNGPAILGRVGLTSIVTNVGKQLIPNPATGLPYRVDGQRYSFMIMSTQNTQEIPSGDWLILDLMIGDTSSKPVELKVIQREQTFAPPPADLQLWGASLGDSLVIWPALSQGE